LKFKIRTGGLYLVNMGRTYSPEFSSPHYCVILKTYDKGLFLAIPTTSKVKNEKFKFLIPEDGSTCLFKHTRTIAKERILKPLLDSNGEQIIVSSKTLEQIADNYKMFVNYICNNAVIGIKAMEEEFKIQKTNAINIISGETFESNVTAVSLEEELQNI